MEDGENKVKRTNSWKQLIFPEWKEFMGRWPIIAHGCRNRQILTEYPPVLPEARADGGRDVQEK